MNIEIGFWDRSTTALGLADGDEVAIVADRERAFQIAESEPFLLEAKRTRRILSCGRVGIECELPASAHRAKRRTLTVWVNPEGHDAETILRHATIPPHALLPVRRLEGSFRVTYGDLAALA